MRAIAKGMRAIACVGCCVAFSIAWQAGALQAATVNQLQISNSCTSDGQLQLVNRSSEDGSTVSGTASGSDPRNQCSNSGSAVAGGGLLALFADSSTTGGPDPREYGGSITVQTSTVYSDIMLTTPIGYAGGPVETALSFSLTGTAGGGTSDGILPSSFLSEFRYSVVVSGGLNGPNIIDQTFRAQQSGGSICPPGGCSQSGPGTFTTTTFLWDPTRPLRTSLGLAGTATTGAYEGGTADASVNLFGTLNFSRTNAFILPEGFSVNYADANIVDNNWIDPRPGTTPVPLPPGLPMLASAFAAFWITRSLRKS